MAKSTLTKDKITQLAKLFRLGAPMAVVFSATQVASSTYYRWVGIGRALAEGDLEHPDIPKPPKRKARESDRKYSKRLRRYKELLQRYVELYEITRREPALSQIDAIEAIRSAALENDDWRAAANLLQRRDPDNWSMKRIRRRLANEPPPDPHEYSDTASELRKLIRIFNESEPTHNEARENNTNAGPRNNPDSLPQAE